MKEISPGRQAPMGESEDKPSTPGVQMQRTGVRLAPRHVSVMGALQTEHRPLQHLLRSRLRVALSMIGPRRRKQEYIRKMLQLAVVRRPGHRLRRREFAPL